MIHPPTEVSTNLRQVNKMPPPQVSSGFHQLCAVNYTPLVYAERTVAKVTLKQLMSEQSRPVMNSKIS